MITSAMENDGIITRQQTHEEGDRRLRDTQKLAMAVADVLIDRTANTVFRERAAGWKTFT